VSQHCLRTQASTAALALFEFGQAEAAKRGLLLVDTKYEMGRSPDGSVVLVDEVDTQLHHLGVWALLGVQAHEDTIIVDYCIASLCVMACQ
jgi:SAICAR synthetase